jgi:methionyl-tRNA formyltransferase
VYSRESDVTTEPRQFGHVEVVVTIGGGDLMLEASRLLRRAGYATGVILAPRHAEEMLPLAGKQTQAAFADDGFDVHVVEDINASPDLRSFACTGPKALALCFGPAWLFRDHVLEAFGAGMINFNGIPIPRYLGGAHYTWQILNGDRTGGCVLQEITPDVDRGPVLRRELFDLPEHVRVPEDYFTANLEAGKRFLESTIADMRADVPFAAIDFATLEDDRLYFPRLHTTGNGWIDWSWWADDIERFCCAFDRPYSGAGTYVESTEVRIADVWLEAETHATHPFNAGLVVRRIGKTAWIAATGGMLRVETARLPDGRDAMDLLREGRRLHTPRQVLDDALIFRPKLTARGFKHGKT